MEQEQKAQIESITDAEVTMVRNNGSWAMFVLRHWQRKNDPLERGTGGSLAVHSSYGTFSYIWGATGAPFKQFLVESLAKDRPYTMRSFLKNDYDTFSPDRTRKSIRHQIIENRKEDHGWSDSEWERLGRVLHSQSEIETRRRDLFTRVRARTLWDRIENLTFPDDFREALESEEGTALFGYDLTGCFRKEPHEWIDCFWNELFLPYASHVKAQLEEQSNKKRA